MKVFSIRGSWSVVWAQAAVWLAVALVGCSESSCPKGAKRVGASCQAEKGNGLDEQPDSGADGGSFIGTVADAEADAAVVRDGDVDLDAAVSDASDSNPSQHADAAISCDDGFIMLGAKCVRDVCITLGDAVAHCGEHATCSKGVSKTPTCTCDAGYLMHELACVRNECISLPGEPPPCGANQTCKPNADGTKLCECDAGFDDCDDKPNNGCEAELESDAEHCSVCGNECADGLACEDSTCGPRFKSISVGYASVCGVTPNDSLLCWGAVHTSLLVENVPTPTPVEVKMIAASDQVSMGFAVSCARTKDGIALWCWGQNNNLELGVSDTSLTTSYLQVGKSVAVGVGENAACAIVGNTAQVRCWGSYANGLLGNQALTANQTFALSQPLTGTANSIDVGVGSKIGCALTAVGTVRCWGSTSMDTRYSVTGVVSSVDGTELVDAVKLSVGAQHACAIRADQTLVCWGANNFGQLGNSAVPTSPVDYVVVPLTGVRTVAAGASYSCASTEEGKAYCWGVNNRGQLGNGSFSTQAAPTPQLVTGLKDVEGIYSGTHASTTCAQVKSGRVFCWGSNQYGSVGSKTASNPSLTPVAITDWPE